MKFIHKWYLLTLIIFLPLNVFAADTDSNNSDESMRARPSYQTSAVFNENTADLMAPNDARAQLPVGNGRPVFDGAEGFGTNTRAGRDGISCQVTTLSDRGPGSLRDCVDLPNARSVSFAVSGIIRLDSTLHIRNPNISILGQTAPGNGVLLTTHPWEIGPVLHIETHDVLIQHMRIRAGASYLPSCCRDAIAIGSQTPGQVYNVVLDHNSLSWATDEILDIWYDSRDITVSYNIISEGIHNSTNTHGPAGRGMLVGDRAKNISIHHNLFAHAYERSPSLQGTGTVDLVNNVIYHGVSRQTQVTAKELPLNVNIVKNLYIARTDSQFQPTNTNWFDVLLRRTGSGKMKVYFEGNKSFWRDSDEKEEWALAGVDWNVKYEPAMGLHTDTRIYSPSVTEYPVSELESILQESVGAFLPTRDSVDLRILNELNWRTGKMPDCVQGCENNASGWPVLQ